MWKKLKAKPLTDKQIAGNLAEAQACNFLIKQGLIFKAKNVRFNCGEIDLVMYEGKQLVFVEVRFRKSASHGGALASVTPQKQLKLTRAAQSYLQEHFGNRPPSCRFDVVGVSLADECPQFQWVKNAF